MVQPSLKLKEQLAKIRQIAEEREAKRRAEAAGLPYLDASTMPIKVEALRTIPEKIARDARVAVFEARKPVLGVVVYDPKDDTTTSIVQKLTNQGYEIKLFVSSLRSLKHVWSFYQFLVPEKPPITSRVNIEHARIIKLVEGFGSIKLVGAAIEKFDAINIPVVEFLEIVLAGAIANRVSDIHFELSERAVKLRYRIDGILYDVSDRVPKILYPAIVSRIKLLSNLKINVSDRPQDGRFTIGFGGKDIEIRVAVAPAEFGESIVLRVLDPTTINLTLSDLGFRPDDREIIEVELRRPNGMILNTGPTGSGKTTTLYAFLGYKFTPKIKIITIEDPVEYHLGGIEQTQVDEEAGYTFSNGLRSMMRQDPDVILVGEIRDRDTAEIAIQAALTGHLVFSTIHANESAGAIPRLLDLGVKSSSIGPALNLVIAQRLVRKLCEQCREQVVIQQELQEKIKQFVASLPKRVGRTPYQNPTIFSPKGCDKCNGVGYSGRVGVFELLLNDPEHKFVKADSTHKKLSSETDLEALIKKQTSESEIVQYALSHGMVTMQQDGVLKVFTGLTTFEEIEAVTGQIAWLRER